MKVGHIIITGVHRLSSCRRQDFLAVGFVLWTGFRSRRRFLAGVVTARCQIHVVVRFFNWPAQPIGAGVPLRSSLGRGGNRGNPQGKDLKGVEGYLECIFANPSLAMCWYVFAMFCCVLLCFCHVSYAVLCFLCFHPWIGLTHCMRWRITAKLRKGADAGTVLQHSAFYGTGREMKWFAILP